MSQRTGRSRAKRNEMQVEPLGGGESVEGTGSSGWTWTTYIALTRRVAGIPTEIWLLLPRPKTYNLLMKQHTLPIIVESDADGYFVSCPALPGCYSQGDTYEVAVANIKDAIRLHLEDRIAGGEEIPEHVSVSLSTVEVAV